MSDEKIDGSRIVTPHIRLDPSDVADAIAKLRFMTAEQRMEIFSQFCCECGSDNPRCQCWNDE